MREYLNIDNSYYPHGHLYDGYKSYHVCRVNTNHERSD